MLAMGTGTPCAVTDLIRLNFERNAGGKYYCPITFKIFTRSSHIVANARTGNVYTWEAVAKLNVKAGNWKDLLDGKTTFARTDILTVQKPPSGLNVSQSSSASARNVDGFYHRKLSDAAKNEKAGIVDGISAAKSNLRSISGRTEWGRGTK